MRHRRRARGTLSTQLLVEVAHGNVGPAIRCKVVGDATKARNIAVEFALPVMGLDLSCQRIPRQSQPFNKVLREQWPRDSGQGDAVRCPGARRTVHLPQVLSVFDA